MKKIARFLRISTPRRCANAQGKIILAQCKLERLHQNEYIGEAILHLAVFKGDGLQPAGKGGLITLLTIALSGPSYGGSMRLCGCTRQGWKKPYGDQTFDGCYICGQDLSISQINHIIKAVEESKTASDQRHSKPKKMWWTSDVVPLALRGTDGQPSVNLLPHMTFLLGPVMPSLLTIWPQ